MKKLTMTEWENSYISGPVERFDQINTMTRRAYADPAMKAKLKGLGILAPFKQESGYSLQDYALRAAPRNFHAQISELNDSKPNPSHLSVALMKTIKGSNEALAYPSRLTKDSKVDVNNVKIMTRDIKKTAAFFGADITGICELDRRWIYSHTCEKVMDGSKLFEYKPQNIPAEFNFAIVMGFEVDYEMTRHVLTYTGGAAHDMASTRMVVTSALLSRFIRNMGYNAIDCNIDDVAITVPMAMQAGLGQLGRNGLLITPRFGPRVRLSAVITDLPLLPDSPVEFGVTEFCNVCKKCARMCPSGSIPNGERTTKPQNISNAVNELKWPQNGETCLIRAANHKYPCASCISVCPYNKPDTIYHRTIRWFTDHVRWADPFYAKMDDSFGYGKIVYEDDFWEKWKPAKY